MPKPKHSFGRKNFEICEQFIDREEAKNLYRNKLNNNRKDYNILVYYGIGGIGKSKLRKEICSLHKSENEKSVSFYLDLNPPEDRNLGTGILKLVDSCDNKKINFKCFEMAYALYFRKKNPSVQYGHEKDKMIDNTFVGIGLNILGIFDNGVTSTAAEIVERTFRFIKDRTIDKQVKEELKHFDEHSFLEMEEMLPLFFQYDLKSYIEKHKDTKVLIIFDTFEALNENVIEPIHKRKNERWVQNIIEYFDRENFPYLLTMIFGRDEIEWDEDWKPLLDQFQLTEFKPDNSKEYLKKIGIDSPEIVDAIIRSSNGYPFLLYLSAETYANMKNTGKMPQPEDFCGTYPEIIERFLYNLDKNTVEVLRLMSIPNYYDDEIFERLIAKYNISFPLTEYVQFNKYSFVEYDDAENVYYINSRMRKDIIDNTPKNTIISVHKELTEYFLDKACKDKAIKYVINMFYHARKGLTVDEFNQWLDTPVYTRDHLTPIQGMKKLQDRGEQNILMQIMNGILAEYGDIRQLKIDLVNIYIDIVHLGGDYEGAVKICNMYLNQFSDDQIYSDEQLIKMRIRKVHHSMFYKPVDKLIADAQKMADRVNIQKYPEQYNELLFLLGGNLGLLYGDLDAASVWLEKSMICAQKNGFDGFVHRTIRKQADILLARDDCDGAMNLIGETVSVDCKKEDIDSRYKIYLMGLLGEIYRKKGDFDSAWKCYDMVEKKSTENNLQGWRAHALLGKGMVEMKLGKFACAEKLLNQALAIYEKIGQEWGKINTREAKLLMRKLQGNPLNEEEIDGCKTEAERMHYQYNVKYAELLSNEEIPYLQLFFL